MKKTKALLGFLIGVAIIGSSFTSTVANAAVKNAQSQTNVVINNSKTKAAPVKVKSSKISNRLTLNQLINEYASDQKVSVNEAKKALGVENSINVESIASPNSRGEFYRTYAITLEVNDDEYEPEIKFYCKTSEWDSYRGIENLLSSTLVRKDAYGTIKGFSGTLYTNLENAYTIHYELNGDFLNTQTTTSTGGVSLGIGEACTISYSTSSSSNEYCYVDEENSYDPFNY